MPTTNPISPYMAAMQSKVPNWKRLGYNSEEDYLNATLKQQTPVTNARSAPILGQVGTTNLPTNLSRYFPPKTVAGYNPSAQNTFTPQNNSYPTQAPTLESYSPYIDMIKTANKENNTASPQVTSDITREERTDEGSYNGTSDFLEAFKQNYGYDYDGAPLERREGMSDGTWNALQSLYKYYQQGLNDEAKKQEEIDSENSYYDNKRGEVEQAYDASKQQLDENKRRAQQNASISLDKLLRYLPAQARAQGYEDLGTSESSALRAYANYNNNMGNISGDYNTQINDLNQGRITETGRLDDSRRASLADIRDRYESYARQREAAAGSEAQSAWDRYVAEEQSRREAEAEELYNSVADSLNMRILSSYGDDGKMSKAQYDEISNYIKGYSDRLSEGQINALNSVLEGAAPNIRSDEEEKEIQKQDAYHTVVSGDADFNNNGGWWIFGATDFSAGDNFSVKDGNRTYFVESGGEVADEEIAQAAFEVGNNQVFGYGGKIYIKRGGKIYLIQKRANSYEGDYNDLYAKYYK